VVLVSDLVRSGEAELTTGPFGTQLKAAEYSDDGTVPVINVRNVGFGDVRTTTLEYISPEIAQRLSRHLLIPGDIVFGRKGAVERHAFIQEGQAGWLQGSDCLRLRLSTARLHPRFVSYFLRTERHQQWMKNHCSHGATMASLNQDILGRIELPLPSLNVQQSVVRVLSAYDDLIDNNTRRIEILEGMARALYREWFVEFRYPGHEVVALVDSNSELGPIPEGWLAAPLFEVADLTFGFAFESKQFNAEGVGTPVIRIRDLPKNRTETCTTETAGSQYEVSDGDVLIGMDGIFHMCRWSAGPAYLNQRVVRLRPADERVSRYQVHLGLERPVRELNDSIVGTTVAHLGKRHLQRLHLPVPPEPLRSEARRALDPLFDLVIALRKATAALRTTRDLLLPRLVSGEVEVSDLVLDRDGLVA
jgi:type I restriction enzyme S subunit